MIFIIIYVQILVGNLISYLSSGLYNLWIECLWVTHADRNFIVNVNKVGGYHTEADNKALMYK